MKELLLITFLLLFAFSVFAEEVSIYYPNTIEVVPYDVIPSGGDIYVVFGTDDFSTKYVYTAVACGEENPLKIDEKEFDVDTFVKSYVAVDLISEFSGDCEIRACALKEGIEPAPGNIADDFVCDTIDVFFDEELEPVELPAFVSIYTNPFVAPGGFTEVFHWIEPRTDFTGLIVTDILPEGLEPHNLEVPDGSHYDYTWDPIINELKFVLLDETGAGVGKDQSYGYALKASPDVVPGTELEFTSGWKVIAGDEYYNELAHGKKITIVEGAPVPQCPMDDLALLEYIDQWANMEFSDDPGTNDQAILEIIEVWKNC